MLANVMTLLLHRMKPNASAKALYPASLDTIVSILRRYAKMSDESAESGAMARGKRRARSVLWLHRRGRAARRGRGRRAALGHARPRRREPVYAPAPSPAPPTTARTASRRRCRYFDSLGAPPDPRLRRAASKALPSFTWVTELPDRLQTDGHSCGKAGALARARARAANARTRDMALWFAESLALEAATQYSWEEYLNDGSIGFLKSGEAFTSELGAKNTRFIARRREAYRSLLESAIVDTSDLRLFEIDEDVDSWAVALPASSRAPPGRAPSRPRPGGAGGPSSSSASSSSSESEAEGDEGGSDGDARPLTPIDRAASPPSARRRRPSRSPSPGPARPGRRGAAAVRLHEGAFSRALKLQLAAYREWRQAPLNASRKGNAVENSSLANDLGIIQRLLGYVRMREGLEGELTLDLMSRVDAVEIVLRFFKFLREERGTLPGTLVSYASTLINLAAFVAGRGGAPAGSEGPHEPARRRVQGGTEVENEKTWVRFEDVVRGRVEAYAAFRSEERPRQKAKYLRNLSCLGSFDQPARPGLLQHLKIGETLRKDNGRWNMSILSMRIQDGSEEGALTHKTAKRHGAVIVPVAQQLQEPLTEYVESFRRHLLSEGAKDQGYIFFTSGGDAFRRGSWTLFAKQAMSRWTGVAVPPRTMRAVVTTWVRDQAAQGRIEGDVCTSIIEGTARLLQHTPRTATMHYDCNKTQREACVALAWLERAAGELEKPTVAALEGPEGRSSSDGDGEEGEGEPGAAAGAAAAAASDDGEEGGSSESEDGGSSEELKEGLRVERELARAEGRWCPECRRIFGTPRGISRHRCSPRTPKARGRSDDDDEEDEEEEEEDPTPKPRAASAAARAGRGAGEMAPPPAPGHTPDHAEPHACAERRGGDGDSAGRPLTTTVRHALDASNEGGPDDYTYPRAAVPVEYRATNGAIDVTTSAEEVMQRLGAAAREAPPAAPPAGRRGSAPAAAAAARPRT
eukprot:tig00020538_g10388.t1